MYKVEYNKLHKRVGEIADRESFMDFDKEAGEIRIKIEKLQV